MQLDPSHHLLQPYSPCDGLIQAYMIPVCIFLNNIIVRFFFPQYDGLAITWENTYKLSHTNYPIGNLIQVKCLLSYLFKEYIVLLSQIYYRL